MIRAIHRQSGPGRPEGRQSGRAVLAVVAVLAVIGSGCATSSPYAGGSPSVAPPTAAPSATPAVPVSWRLSAVPSPPGSTASYLNAVACAGASDCWAVGSSNVAGGGSEQALIEQNTGGGWAMAQAPAPPAAGSSQLESVTCAGAGECWATGFSTDGSGGQHTLIEEDTGGGWNDVSSPSPSGGGDVRLDAVACAAAADCWAVGFSDAAGTVIERYTGATWSTAASPTPPGGPGGVLSGVACARAADCWAVGSAYNSGGRQAPLIEHDTGSGWSIVSSPTPNGSPESVLDSVTCAGTGGCWAVGDTYDAAGAEVPLIEQTTGGGWSIVPSLTPSNSVFDAVACAGAGDCWAAGFSSTTPGGTTFQTLIEHYTQGAWSIVPSTPPPGSTDTEVDGIACVSATSCWAAGSSGDVSPTSGQALVEQLQPSAA